MAVFAQFQHTRTLRHIARFSVKATHQRFRSPSVSVVIKALWRLRHAPSDVLFSEDSELNIQHTALSIATQHQLFPLIAQSVSQNFGERESISMPIDHAQAQAMTTTKQTITRFDTLVLTQAIPPMGKAYFTFGESVYYDRRMFQSRSDLEKHSIRLTVVGVGLKFQHIFTIRTFREKRKAL